jgi:tetratricopeptide (TPR) repeat protein
VALQLSRQGLATWIPVYRLDADDTAALAEQAAGERAVPSGVMRDLYERTDGNPFFVREVVHSLLEGGALDAGAHARVPERVRAVIEERLGRLDGTARAILGEASVLGQRFRFDDLQAVSGRSEEALEEALETACAASILRAVDTEQYAFVHALTREAVYADLPPRRRRRLHLAAAAAIEHVIESGGGDEHGRRTDELAWHYLHGEDVDRAVRYAVRAGDEAEEVFAHRDAAEQYRTALAAIWAHGKDRAIEAQALEKLGGVLGILGQWAEAIETLERAIQVYEALEDIEGQRRAVATVGSLHAQRGTIEDGLLRLQPYLDRRARASAGLTELHLARAQLESARGAYRDSLAAARAATTMAREIGEPDLVAAADLRQAEALGILGRHRDAQRLLESVVASASSVDPGTLSRAFATLGTASLQAGQFRQSRAYRARALELAEHTGSPAQIGSALLFSATTNFYLGEWDTSAELLERADVLASGASGSLLGCQVGLSRGLLDLYRGDDESGRARVNASLRWAEEHGYRSGALNAEIALAEADMQVGRSADAVARLSALVERMDEDTIALSDLLLTLATACLEAGDVSRAGELLTRALVGTTGSHSRLGFLEMLLVQGAIHRREGLMDEATNVLEGALTLARGMPYPFAEARALSERGMVARGAERRRLLNEATAIFERLGAVPLSAKVQRVLGK